MKETDLHILAEKDLRVEAAHLVAQYRNQLESYIARNPRFLKALNPLDGDPLAPPLIKEMMKAALAAGVGPMAAVAGCVAEYVGKALLSETDQVIVENGGDIFLSSTVERTLAIYAGEDNPLSMRMGLRIPAELNPLGICTSSGVVGHSLSLGLADAAMVISVDTALSDAAATALGNRITKPKDVEPGLDWALSLKGVIGAVVILGDTLGVRGEALELVEL